jgi:5-methylcytosine-specific restriction endonuclease McrA
MTEANDCVDYDGPIVTRAQAKAQGLKRFFLGTPCKHGHIAQRQTTNRRCFACKVQPTKEYLAAGHAKNPGRRAAHLEKHAPKARAHHKLVYVENREQILARNKAWQEANPEAYKAAIIAWHKAHPDRLKAIHRKWEVNNPEQLAANAREVRAKRRNVEGKHTVDEIKALLEKQRGKCAYCHVSIRSGYHADHIVPLAKGGSNWISNIQLTCPPCNFRKNRTDPITFSQRLGRLL